MIPLLLLLNATTGLCIPNSTLYALQTTAFPECAAPPHHHDHHHHHTAPCDNYTIPQVRARICHELAPRPESIFSRRDNPCYNYYASMAFCNVHGTDVENVSWIIAMVVVMCCIFGMGMWSREDTIDPILWLANSIGSTLPSAIAEMGGTPSLQPAHIFSADQ